MRYAICNELFDGWDHARVCSNVAELGYRGLELAPFTLGPRLAEVTTTQRSHRQAEVCGLQIVGLRSLTRTEGLQLTAPTPGVRQRTADYLAELARCTRELGGELMVLGSPAQRRIPPWHQPQVRHRLGHRHLAADPARPGRNRRQDLPGAIRRCR